MQEKFQPWIGKSWLDTENVGPEGNSGPWGGSSQGAFEVVESLMSKGLDVLIPDD